MVEVFMEVCFVLEVQAIDRLGVVDFPLEVGLEGFGEILFVLRIVDEQEVMEKCLMPRADIMTLGMEFIINPLFGFAKSG